MSIVIGLGQSQRVLLTWARSWPCRRKEGSIPCCEQGCKETAISSKEFNCGRNSSSRWSQNHSRSGIPRAVEYHHYSENQLKSCNFLNR